MAAPISDRHRLVLWSRDRHHGVLLDESTGCEFVRRVVVPEDRTADDSLVPLAQTDPSFAAWLIDLVTGGALGELLRLSLQATKSACSGPLLPPDWQGISELLSRTTAATVLDSFIESLDVQEVDDDDVALWQAAHRRLCDLLPKTHELARSECPERVDEVGWWAMYLLTPWGTSQPDGAAFVLSRPGWHVVEVPAEHPWHPCLQCIRLAIVQTDASCREELGPPSRGERLGPVARSTLTAVVPAVLRMARRHAQLENDFQGSLEEEKLRAMKELAYGASHEINNPLANISSRAQLLLRDEVDPERRRSLATINSQAFRAHEMIADMMLFAKPPALQFATFGFPEYYRELVGQLEADLPAGIQFTQAPVPREGMLHADAVQLTVALRAIWSNALEAMGDRGQMRVGGRVVVSTPADRVSAWAEIEFEDSGPGIRPEVRRHLFDPFFSGREAGRGLGFGLSKAWRIVGLHGGQIRVHSEPGEGAMFTVRLPLADAHG